MPSEQRLHPATVLFAFAESLKKFALPGLLVTLGAGRAAPGWPGMGAYPVPSGWELWLMLLLIPSSLAAIARYMSFRLRYDETELVIRTGILFRNERHVPYHRIQNLEAVQNLFHRALRVTEVRIETGASKEPEATISVVPAAAFPDMRRRVFAGRATPESDARIAAADSTAVEAGQTLLRLPLRELLLCGFIENRGLVIIGTGYGLLWESGILGAIWQRVFDSGAYPRGLLRGMIGSIASGGGVSAAQVGLAVLGIAGLLATVRLVSMGWAVVRLYGFQLSRAGEDLRTEFGLFTHVAATIPLQRVQTMTVREGPLHRLLSRVSVRVETAGGNSVPGQRANEREWLAPIVHRRDLPALGRHVLSGLDVSAFDWQPPHPRAFRRAVKPALALAVLMTTLAALVVHWRLVAILPLALAWAVVATRQQLRHFRWAASDDAVALKSGWLWRSLTVARIAKVQAVARIESPFDRHTAMARVRVDTAGAGERSHRIDVPYLPRDAAIALHSKLAAAAAGTAFRW